MKPLQIILAALIIIGLGLLATQKWWLPKLDDFILNHETTAMSANIYVCHETDKYFAIEKSSPDSVGTSILIKYKTASGQEFPCAYKVAVGDFEINNGEPDYLIGFAGDYLLLDRGTSPDPRTLLVYSLQSKSLIYTDQYAKPISISGEQMTYWEPTTAKPTAANCSQLAEYTSEGLGAVVESEVMLDLPTLTKKDLGQYRCEPTQ